MMAERDRLGTLQVREPGHHVIRMGCGPVDQHALECLQARIHRVDCIADPQPEIGCDLIVAAARGVKPTRNGSDQLGQPGLGRHVNVFKSGILG